MSDSIRWMFHGTAMVRDFDAAVAAMGELFGRRVLYVTDEGGTHRPACGDDLGR
jgi:hypothetical protein